MSRPPYKNHTCGVCGNFNGNAEDDHIVPEYATGCREKHPGCKAKDAGFVYPKQLYNKTCGDIEKVEFPVYGDACKQIKEDQLNQCEECIESIPDVCLHASNLPCIKLHEKTCVTDLFTHFLRTCYATVFQAGVNASGNRKKRDLR